MSKGYSLCVQDIINILELYLESQQGKVEKQLQKIRSINAEIVSEELCLSLDMKTQDEKKQLIKSLIELINS